MKRIPRTSLFFLFTILSTSVMLLFASGCSKNEKPTPQSAAPATAAEGMVTSSFDRLDGSVQLAGQPRSVAGITFRPPADWLDLGPSGMRAASYALADMANTSDTAMVAVFHFPSGGGGSVADNIARWVGQVTPEDGRTRDQAAVYDKLVIKELSVSTVEIDGSYTPAMGPGAAAGPKAGYRLVGAVVEGPEGNLFFRLTGPRDLTEKMLPGFVAMIKQLGRFGTGVSAG